MQPISNDRYRPRAAGDKKDTVMDMALPKPDASQDLTPDEIALLHRASKTSTEPPAMLLRIVTLLPCSPSHLAGAPIELIDRHQGILRLRDPSGAMTEVALGYDAAAAVAAAAGDRTKGPLVIDTYGNTLICDDDTEDYARELLMEAVPATSAVVWTMSRIRDAMFGQLVDYGTPAVVAAAQAGIGPQWPDDEKREDMLLNQRAAADWWTYRMGLRPPSPFVLVHAVKRVRLFDRSTIVDIRPRRTS